MMLFKGKVSCVTLFYVLSLVIALAMALWSVKTGYVAVSGGDEPKTAIDFFIYILLTTGFLLFLSYVLRKYLHLFVFVLELFFLFVTASLFFYAYVGPTAAAVWSLLLVLVRVLLPRSEIVRNVSVSFVAGVSAGLIGASLSVTVALLLYALLVVYDFVSVLVTGHMVKLAESIEEGLRAPRPTGEVALGAGDLAVPAIFASSLIKLSAVALVSAVGAVVGTLFAFYCLKRLKHPLPALPYIGAVQLSFTALSLFLSTLLL